MSRGQLLWSGKYLQQVYSHSADRVEYEKRLCCLMCRDELLLGQDLMNHGDFLWSG